ncbi:isoprenyl transferase [Bacillus sp. FSL W7-1360]
MLEKFSKWRASLTATADDTYQKELDKENIPQHVAIIMDGNGRWAKSKGLPRIAGHREGMKAVRKIVRAADGVGVRILTLYAFSTENWSRPKTEVDFLLKLPERYLKSELPTLIAENVQVRLMGVTDGLPASTVRAIDEAIEKTRHNTGLVLNLALNYGSRFEMVQVMQQLAEKVANGTLPIDQIDAECVDKHLMSQSLRDPDLLIRTSGEIRLSNFMLWQLAYSELWFTDVLWPDFTESHLKEAICVYQQRGRRYGGI